MSKIEFSIEYLPHTNEYVVVQRLNSEIIGGKSYYTKIASSAVRTLLARAGNARRGRHITHISNDAFTQQLILMGRR